MAAACQALGTATEARWPLQTFLELGALASAPGCARGHIRSVLCEWGLADRADTAELLVSELMTNGVRASEALRGGEGRGLMLVESLGQDWGAYRAETGKVVWVAL